MLSSIQNVERIELGDLVITVTRKDVKHVHLSVHPPEGAVNLVAPLGTRIEAVRAYAISRLGWIRRQQLQIAAQPREAARAFVERESHYLWGRRYLLSVREVNQPPKVELDHRRLQLIVRPGTSREKRAEIMHKWHKTLLHAVIPDLIRRWEPRLGVQVSGYFLQRMKTRWGSSNPEKRNIRLNTELVKKPRDLLEYVVVHELAHLQAPGHGADFIDLMNIHWPRWRESRMELNALPLGSDNPSDS